MTLQLAVSLVTGFAHTFLMWWIVRDLDAEDLARYLNPRSK